MFPAKRNKIDISNLTDEEKKLFALYGKPPGPSLLRFKERKYFDSGDYALSKAGRAPQTVVGTVIPCPENIPHASSPPTPSTQSESMDKEEMEQRSGSSEPEEKRSESP